MTKVKKFYVVWKGRKTGIFTTWEACKAEIEGFKSARYKSFENRAQAEQAFQNAYSQYVAITPKLGPSNNLSEDKLHQADPPILESYSVDAACSGNPGPLEYRCVHNASREVIFKEGPYENGTNNIGEFLAIVHALALFKREKITLPIYSDSKVAMVWIGKKSCRTKLLPSDNNAQLFKLIEWAEKWLQENVPANRVLKWKTNVWGEIPADYGRK